MRSDTKAARIALFSFSTPAMRAFHMSWLAFFFCFFAWFGIAPLMKVVREELRLTPDQVGWCIVGSVAITVLARMVAGWLCDRIGPRRTYSGLLLIGSLPVMAIGLAHSFETFLLFRVLIGVIGAGFVITQFHTTVMFAPNCVGTANATTAGWGNLGGGVTQAAMPLLFTLLVSILGFSPAAGWRLCMVVAGVLIAVMGVAYWFLTQDLPAGDYVELRRSGALPPKQSVKGAFAEACRDRRVWALAAVYAACFGIELTIDNVIALYFVDYFDGFKQMSAVESVRTAGLFASMFGLMHLFARTLGGFISDRSAAAWGLSGRVKWLFLALFGEGLALMLFAQISVLAWAIPSLLLFGLFMKMSEGATYSIVPFINKRALGSVAGVVGAGGNVGAVAAGLLFKGQIPWPTAFFMLGVAVTVISFLSFAVKFDGFGERELSLAPLAEGDASRPELAGASVGS
jgi:NNP family nitrate/nitrite transporter-like MFS transporter